MTTLRKWLLTCAMSLAFGSVALADQGTVFLTDGSQVQGEILSYGQGADVVIQMADGQVVTIQAANVQQVQVDESAFQVNAQVEVVPQPQSQQYQQQPQQYPQQQQQQYYQPQPQFQAPPARRPSLAAPFIFAGIGVGLLAVGGALIATSETCSAFDDFCVTDPSLYVGAVLGVAGVAMLVIGLAILLPKRLRARRQWSAQNYSLAPIISRERAGLALTARF